MYVELKLKTMDMLKQVHTVSLTSDIWTCSHNNESFLSFTCHWISINDMIQHHCVLNVRHFPGRHTGLAIKDTLEYIRKTIGGMGFRKQDSFISTVSAKWETTT